MTYAVERLHWRFDAYRRLFEACAQGGVAPLKFLTLKPERLRLRFGESLRHTQVPVVFAPDLGDRLAALLPPRTPSAPSGGALDRDALRRHLALAQLDADLDPMDVLGWRGADGFLSACATFYARLFEEARASGGGEETAALFQLIAHSSLRNVLVHQVGATERFLGLAALVAYLSDRALTASVEQAGAGLSARLGLLLMAACSPLSIMGAANAIAERPANAYRTVPSALSRARRAVREGLDRPGGLDLVALRAHLAGELLVDPTRRRDIERTTLAEAARDLALLSTLTQGSELRDLASRSSALTESLFTPLGPEKLKERLSRHPSAGAGPLQRLAVLADSASALVAGAGGAQLPGSVDERANLAALGALVLALDEVALEQGAEALASVRPVPPQEAEEARADGRAYWFGFDDQPLYLLPRLREEGFFFVDMKDFTQRTAKVRADAMGDFLSRRFYNPILRYGGHLNRGASARVQLVNLLGDAVAARGDVVSMVELSVFVLKLLEDAAQELAEGAAELRHSADEVLAEIDVELARVEEQLLRLAPGPERASLEKHRAGLLSGRDQRLAQALGAGLEGSAFVAYGTQATVIEVGGADLGNFSVTIAEHLNAAARGTSRSVALAKQRRARREADARAAGRDLIDPFRVHTSSDPELLAASGEFHNTGAALTGEALAAYRSARKQQEVSSDLTVSRELLARGLPGVWFPRKSEDLVVARSGGRITRIFRRTGRTVFRGLESRGGTEIWEIIPVDAGFGRSLAEVLADA